MEEEEKRLCVCGGRREIMEEVQKERIYRAIHSHAPRQSQLAGRRTPRDGGRERLHPLSLFTLLFFFNFFFIKCFIYSLSKIVGIFFTLFFLSSFIVMKEIVRSRVFSV